MNDDSSHVRLKPNGERLPESGCPACGERLNATASTNTPENPGKRPEPGDITLCGHCGSWLWFNEDYSMRLMTPQEAAALPDDVRTHMAKLRAAIRWLDDFVS